jgi:catecholate siderophore receptor
MGTHREEACMTRSARRKKIRQQALVGAFVASAAMMPRRAVARELEQMLRASRALQAAQAVQTSPSALRFDIAPGPLAVVAQALRQATGLAITLPDDTFGAIYSPGVSGLFSVEEALTRALAGTTLSFRFRDSRTVVIEFRATAEHVDVAGRAPVTIVSPKFTEPLRDIPQSIDVVPSELLADQGVTTLRDAVRNVAGISIAAGEGGAQGDNLTIRGFTARNDIFIDGMRDFGSYYRDPFNQEEVQVLKGPSSVAFGRGTTGGVLNQATKTPTTRGFVNGTAMFGSDMTRRATLDVNEPIPALGDSAAFRLNAMATSADVAERDIAHNERYGIAPSLSLGLGSATRVMFTGFHQAENDVPDYGIPWLYNGPAPVARNNYYGFASGNNFLKTRADIASAKVEHTVSPNVTVTDQVRYANYGRDAQITEAQIPAGTTLTTPIDSINVNRNQITVDSTETFLQNQLDVTSRFATGSIHHTLVAGLELSHETSDPIRTTWTGVPPTSLVSPNPQQAFAGTGTISTNTDATAISSGVYALDTISLGAQWDVMAGARFDRFDANVSQSVGVATAYARVDQKPSWRGALVFKPTEFGSIYFDAGTSFNPSAEALSLSAANVSLPPETNQTIEVGTKWDLAEGRLSLRAAAFQTTKLNAREPDPNNALLNVLSGTQRVNGVEGEMSGKIHDRWRVQASYAFMDSALIASVAYPAAVGSQLANAPRNTFNVWNTFELPWRLEMGGGAQFVGMRTASTTVPLDPLTGLVKALPGYWVGNAMARRALGSRVDLQLNVNNLTNAYFFDQLHPAHIVPGAGRTALLGLNFKY